MVIAVGAAGSAIAGAGTVSAAGLQATASAARPTVAAEVSFFMLQKVLQMSHASPAARFAAFAFRWTYGRYCCVCNKKVDESA
jgi:hypothetical protein